MGILVCGLNGSGKSTLGRALAAALRLRFLDSEDLYFPDGRFDAPRTREEFLAALDAATREGDFVFASVKGNGRAGAARAHLPGHMGGRAPGNAAPARAGAVLSPVWGADAPGRGPVRGGGEVLRPVASRSDEEMRAWAAQLPWPVLRVDGTRPVQALVPEVCSWISETTGL